ncbi:MAG: hypothetical protein B6245_24105 [Desulfobacteraceae bacterium 4572_88]|nr:MAG: hypothetical protein B6245_24105 [Desulfobacteraceae bacterium 4572_88]
MQEIRIRHSDKKDIPAIKEIYEGESVYSGTFSVPGILFPVSLRLRGSARNRIFSRRAAEAQR